VALAFSLVGFAELLRDFGLSAAAIQTPTLSQEEKSNLFWLNALLGFASFVLVVLLAYPLGMIFDETGLTHVILGMSVVFLLNGLGTQFQAQLSRDFRFLALASTDVIAQAVALTVGVVLALRGAGYWALIALQITAAGLILAFRVVVSGWLPSRPARAVSVRRHLRFGVNLMLAQALGFIANSVPNVALGATQSTAHVGLFNRAFQIVNIPINQVFAPMTNVALSALAKVPEPARYRRAIREMALLISFTGVACFSLLASTADFTIPLLLGPQWLDAVPIVQLLAMGACFQAMTYPYFWVFLSLGRTHSLLRYNLITKSGLAGLGIAGGVVSAPAAAAAFALGLALSWPICAWWLRSEERIDGRGHVVQSIRLLLSGAVAGAAAWLTLRAVATTAAFGLGFLASVAVWLVAGAACLIFLGGRTELMAVWGIVRRMRR